MRCFALLEKLAAAFAIACTLLGAAGPAHADEIEVTDVRLASTEDGLVLAADFAFNLNARLSEAVTNGIPLYFVVEFELNRPRWYWFDEKAASKRLQLRLSYHALSRHYRLSTGPLQQNYPTLEAALNVLRRVRNWQVVDRSVTLADANYEAAVRMRVDSSLLPKPFQVSALTTREFNLESPWKRFIFRPPPPHPAPVESREPKEVEPR